MEAILQDNQVFGKLVFLSDEVSCFDTAKLLSEKGPRALREVVYDYLKRFLAINLLKMDLVGALVSFCSGIGGRRLVKLFERLERARANQSCRGGRAKLVDLL